MLKGTEVFAHRTGTRVSCSVKIPNNMLFMMFSTLCKPTRTEFYCISVTGSTSHHLVLIAYCLQEKTAIMHQNDCMIRQFGKKTCQNVISGRSNCLLIAELKYALSI